MATDRAEAVSAEKQQLQWKATQDFSDVWDASLAESLFCPCIVYGRTSNRVRAALGDRDVATADDRGFCVPDCVQFTFCFPFYGCLIAKLQSTVRAFYSVNGTDVSDWTASCFCPCVALVRNEKEIMLRERQQGRIENVNNGGSTSAEQYQSPDPMEHHTEQRQPPDSMEHPLEQLRAPLIRDHVPQLQLPPVSHSLVEASVPEVPQVGKQKLPPIAEVSREPSTASGSMSQTGHKG